MTKKDLRTGMVITCRNGIRYVVIKDYLNHNEGVVINVSEKGGYLELRDFSDDLTANRNSWIGHDYDVIKVERSPIVCDIRRVFNGGECDYETIWTRPYNDFKVVCLNNSPFGDYTVGKIYEVKNGTLIADDGTNVGSGCIDSFDYLEEHSAAEWLKVVE